MSTLRTSRLTLLQASREDAAFIFELLNSPTWLEHIGDRGIKTEEDALGYIDKSLVQTYEKFGFGLMKMVHSDSGRDIGLCGLLKRDYLDFPDIGFAVLPEFEGRGYTFEMAKEILEAERKRGVYPQILAITTDNNTRSRALLEKLGLSYVEHISIPKDSEKLRLYSIRF
jgi:[ribosomal protein S5]-alanine N-acetyltransferase